MSLSPQIRQQGAADMIRALATLGSANLTTLTSELGLSRPTVQGIAEQLEEAGLVESVLDRGTTGRPASMVSLAAHAGVVVAVDVQATRFLLAEATLGGEILDAEPIEVSYERISGDQLLQQLASLIRRAAARHSDRGSLLAVGVANTGIIDDGVLLRSSHVPQWEQMNIAAELQALLDVPVVVENDINLAAIGEFGSRVLRGSLGANSDMLYVRLTQTLNSGLILSGHLHRGHQGAAGEISDALGSGLLDDGDPWGTEWIDRAALTVGALVAAVAPECLVLSTPNAEAEGVLEEVIRRLHGKRPASAARLNVQASHFQWESGIIGALSLALGCAHQGLFGVTPEPLYSLHGVTRIAEWLKRAEASGTQNVGPAIRVGIVGAGHRAYLARHVEDGGNNARIVAVCDPHPRAATRMKKTILKSIDDVVLVGTVDELIAVGIDAAIVISPDNTHRDVAVRLLEAGIPTYLEKPIDISVSAATEILETARRTETKLYVGHNMRHMGVVRTLRNIVRSGRIGQVKAIWCRHFVGNGGDYYFKDWHADRSKTNSLLLQKAAHDIDVMHWIAQSTTAEVVAMGGETLYRTITDRKDRSDQLQREWFDLGNWPPRTQQGLNPVVDVEDLSMVLMRLESGVFASYQQCHYTPDYWRNYTIIGDEGRVENFGDGEGGIVKLWDHRRHGFDPTGDAEYPIVGDAAGHDDADGKTIAEFFHFIRGEVTPQTSPVGAWQAVATGVAATESLRHGFEPRVVPTLPADLIEYFSRNQV